MSSSVWLYPRLSICTWAVLYVEVASVRCSGPCCYRRRSLTFLPRVHCCVAWYNALLAHLPKTERVQMRALRIIYLWTLYNLLKSLDSRTGAVSSVWALWNYLQKAGPCQPVIKHYLSIYLFIHSILQCLKTRIKNNYRFTKHFNLYCSLRTLEMAFLGEHAALPRP